MVVKGDELLLARLEDKIEQANDKYMIVSGDFLDTHQRKVAEDFCKGKKLPVKVVFYGGYEDAERCIPVFLPEYVNMPEDGRLPDEVRELLRVIRVTVPKGSRKLTHRDYLGSLLALGLEREVTGDILVQRPKESSGGGADIIVKAEIAEFISLNYDKAGRTNLDVTTLPIDELDIGTVDIIKKTDTVASLRLDNVVSAAFGMSRAKSQEAIRRGIVSVNSIETLKVDMEVHEKDKISCRGRGKVVLYEIGGTSRKDRIRVVFNIYSQ